MPRRPSITAQADMPALLLEQYCCMLQDSHLTVTGFWVVEVLTM